jgi:trans-aconitate 2-methyltransferase
LTSRFCHRYPEIGIYLDVEILSPWEAAMWDPGEYRRFGDERSRPFFDLLAQVGAEAPGVVVDLGCGPGTLTTTLARRWPRAQVRGIDSSAEMIEAARALEHDAGPRLSFALGDVSDWEPDGPVDVIVSNAVLQWVPDHLAVVARWAGFLTAGGWLAFQIPGNGEQPGDRAVREVAGSERWRPLLDSVRLNRQAAGPAEYLNVLARAGLEADVWETTYLHVLHGDDPVTGWYRGTGMRPVLAALPHDQAQAFLADYRARIKNAYPSADYGTIFPFRRVFAVAVRL